MTAHGSDWHFDRGAPNIFFRGIRTTAVIRANVIGKSASIERLAGNIQRSASVMANEFQCGSIYSVCCVVSPECPARSCFDPVVFSRLNHGAQETFLAPQGVRQEGRQEEGVQAFGQAQCEEGWQQEAPFPQAQLQEGRRRRRLGSWYALLKGGPVPV